MDPQDRSEHINFKAFHDLKAAMDRGEKKAWFEIVGSAIVVTIGSAMISVEAKRGWKDAKILFHLIDRHRAKKNPPK